MKIDLTGKVALVTGASRGIGRAIAECFVKAGARVSIAARNASAVEETAQSLSRGSNSVLATACDVSDAKAVQGLIHNTLDKLGPIDILVNNAGVVKDNLLALMSEEEWDQVLKINLKGAFVCTKAVVRGMIKKRWGRIINISSITGVKGNAGQANYAASKAGLIGFTKTLAVELGSRGITANAITPGYIETAMTKGLPEAARGGLLKRIPVRRFGTSEDTAYLVTFLASEQAGYITGQAIGMDGGLIIG